MEPHDAILVQQLKAIAGTLRNGSLSEASAALPALDLLISMVESRLSQ